MLNIFCDNFYDNDYSNYLYIIHKNIKLSAYVCSLIYIIFFEPKNLIDFFSNLIKYLNAVILGKKIKNRYAIVI